MALTSALPSLKVGPGGCLRHCTTAASTANAAVAARSRLINTPQPYSQNAARIPGSVANSTSFIACCRRSSTTSRAGMGVHQAFGFTECAFQGFDLFRWCFVGLSLLEFGATHGQLDLGPFQIGIV
ncbi:hypothetical protein D9M73_206820 [compost metagenome]